MESTARAAEIAFDRARSRFADTLSRSGLRVPGWRPRAALPSISQVGTSCGGPGGGIQCPIYCKQCAPLPPLARLRRSAVLRGIIDKAEGEPEIQVSMIRPIEFMREYAPRITI